MLSYMYVLIFVHCYIVDSSVSSNFIYPGRFAYDVLILQP